MDELKEVKRAVNPTEVLLVVDAMTGQEAAGAILLLSLIYELRCFWCYLIVTWVDHVLSSSNHL